MSYDICSLVNQQRQLRKLIDDSTNPRRLFTKTCFSTLVKKAYRIQVLHTLNEEDYPNRTVKFAEFVAQIEN